MNIKENFLSSLSAPPKQSSQGEACEFLGKIYETERNEASPILQLLSGGWIHAESPWSFELNEMDCFLLLYTEEGCGKLLLGNQVYSLNPATLLFFDCHCHFRMDIAAAPWSYQILFLTGELLPYYMSLLPEKQPILVNAPAYSDVVLNLERIAAHYPGNGMDRRLVLSDLLNRVVIYCISHALQENKASGQIPPYLEDMRELFDYHFQELYTLDGLEARLGVSKYRLCREFKEAYGTSPLQYLNMRRIEIARHMLVTENLHIHEVGSRVGIDNTNHFIRLFKRFVGVTPLEYRQRMTT